MTAFKTALASFSKPVQVKERGSLPSNIIADVLNTAIIDKARAPVNEHYTIHVSELTRTGVAYQFCPRQHVLHYFERKQKHGRRLTPGLDLLYASGNQIHNYVRDSFITRSNYGNYVWGVWKCLCGKTSYVGLRPIKVTRANICKHCKSVTDNYHEYSLYWPRYQLVGHPDLIIKYSGRYYVYEIKSIDRKGLDFDTLDAPLGDHTLQGSFYVWMMHHIGFKVISKCRYLYVDRNNSKLFRGQVYKEFRKKVSGKVRLDPFLKKADIMIEGIKNKRLPNRICPSINCSRAKTCKVSVSCFNRKRNVITS